MHTSEITLDDMLLCREARAQRQRALLARHPGHALLCFSMNIPGPQKDGGPIRFAFLWGLEKLLAQTVPVHREVHFRPTGPEAFLVFAGEAAALKGKALRIEDGEIAGRLFDMDVLGAQGQKLERKEPRRCLLCESPAALCARSRAHGLPALLTKAHALLEAQCAKALAQKAREALVCEALVTPKPGLVDMENHGAHRDMCLSTLLKSAAVLEPYLERAALCGFSGLPPAACMEALAALGLEAEAAMLEASGGVNVHRGALYAFGLYLSAQCHALRHGGDSFARAAHIAQCGISAALQRARMRPESHGEAAYARFGALGARGEAAAGFPHARRAAGRIGANGRLGPNGAALAALSSLMAEMEDTNLLHRGGKAGLAFVQKRAKAAEALPPALRIQALRELDAQMREKNLSPGGSADMLALGLYLHAMEAYAPAFRF